MNRDVLNKKFASIKQAAIDTGLTYSTIYHYATNGFIDGAFQFAGIRWMIPRKWIKDYNDGKLDMSGAFVGHRDKWARK